jgi:PAB-dependent poly(A)-specific ribonuclease subunit 2
VEITVDPVNCSVTVIEGATDDTKDVEKSKESTGSTDSTTRIRAVYELTAVIAHVHDEFDTDKPFQEESEGHLVAHVKIPSSYSDSFGGISLASPGPGVSPSTASSKLQLETAPVNLRGAPTTSDWVLFNDFCIAPTTASDVVTLYGKQKVPCLLYYSRVEAPVVDDNVPEPEDLPVGQLTIQPVPAGSQERSQASPISDDTFKRLIMETRSPQESPAAFKPYTTFLPFDMTTEFPLPRMLLGLDAEFVALSPAEKGTREDGAEYIIRPARLGLARVSVVRGEGLHAGVCCIDDYIRAVEPVYDYLTRYSGVSPGDLRHLSIPLQP